VTNLLDLRQQARRHCPELPSLPALQSAAVVTWRGRMVNEYQSAQVFDGLAQQARQLELSAAVVEQLAESAHEERKHGVLCGAVVEALGAEACAVVTEQRALPAHAGVPALEGFLRNVLSVSCLSETVAVALIGAERLEMPEGELRNLLSGIWADEIGHARLGWRIAQELVPALGSTQRQRLSLYLRVALRHLERHELAHLPLASRPPAAGAALGLCNGADARLLFYQTVEEAILPPLAALGLAAHDAWITRHSADALLAGTPQ
jgi:hypothetical protein